MFRRYARLFAMAALLTVYSASFAMAQSSGSGSGVSAASLGFAGSDIVTAVTTAIGTALAAVVGVFVSLYALRLCIMWLRSVRKG